MIMLQRSRSGCPGIEYWGCAYPFGYVIFHHILGKAQKEKTGFSELNFANPRHC